MTEHSQTQPPIKAPNPLLSFLGSIWDTVCDIAHTRHGATGGAILLFMAIVALLAPIIAPYDPQALTPASLAPPSWDNPMGTDNIGRDVFSLVVYGTRTSLGIGFATALGALVLGGTVGMLAGYFGGLVDTVLMRVAELFQTLPVIVLVLFTVAFFGSSFWLLITAMVLAIWPIEARLVYGQYLRLRNMNFIDVARVADMSAAHIMLRELLPNAIQPVIVQIALDASVAILIEAGLGFLGLSDPNVVSWGQLLYEAQSYMTVAWWISLFPGAAICLAIAGLNLFADGLNEIVDPRARGRKEGYSNDAQAARHIKPATGTGYRQSASGSA
ncbi:ABC transporter permease (plasmid) [Aquicoccus sp. G2-2]|uniref:ABC transporter permease n=1 Tax=Aquicoccus sp. G2-2 TaxID=3092120 RepID=UPI002ADFE07B|nr:ABC transporter permease [Aquicoccus sp. G2-2]MEA1112004.1 ABC transporter permease [Aquicoccus sp. G2-2]